MSSPTFLDSLTSNLLILIFSKMKWEAINRTRRTCRWMCEFIEENKRKIQIPVGFKEINFEFGNLIIKLPERKCIRQLTNSQTLFGYRMNGSFTIRGLEENQVEMIQTILRNFKVYDLRFDMVSQERIEAVLFKRIPRIIHIRVFAGLKKYRTSEMIEGEKIPYDENLTAQPAFRTSKVLFLDGCMEVNRRIFSREKIIFFNTSTEISLLNGIIKDFIKGNIQPSKIFAQLMNFKHEDLFSGLNSTLQWSEESHSTSKLAHIPIEKMFQKMKRKKNPIESHFLYTLSLPDRRILAVGATKSTKDFPRLFIIAYKSTKHMFSSYKKKGMFYG